MGVKGGTAFIAIFCIVCMILRVIFDREIDMTIQELREKAGMSRPEFAEYFGIPYRSVQNWELGVRECPEYLRALVEYKLEKEGLLNQ